MRLIDRLDNSIKYSAEGGLGNALLSFMILSARSNIAPEFLWYSHHTRDNDSIYKYIVSKKPKCHLQFDHTIIDSDIDYILPILSYDRNKALKFMRFKQERKYGVAALHLRLGDFKNYSLYYIPTPDFVKKALQFLHDNIHTIIVFTNGTKEEIADILKVIPDKYTVLFDDPDETHPDLVLERMALCEAMIRTGSTLSFCAAVLGNIPTVISSTQNSCWSEHLSLDLPGWHTIII